MRSVELHPDPHTAHVRVCVALQMTLDREAIARAMSILRPNWDVREVLPEQLDACVLHEHPDVVICSELTDTVVAHAPMWFLLHPYGSPRCVVAINDVRQEEPNMQLTSIFAHIDRVYG